MPIWTCLHMHTLTRPNLRRKRYGQQNATWPVFMFSRHRDSFSGDSRYDPNMQQRMDASELATVTWNWPVHRMRAHINVIALSIQSSFLAQKDQLGTAWWGVVSELLGPSSILISGYCLCGALHVLPISIWVSSWFFIYLIPPKNMPVGGTAMLTCP